ncbi:fam-m protein [Plasmodium malariae]|uniref:Fam-m protein n=1 Tax=Plasmodium malariae TaxID=5858 RepID=A0A1D3JHQ9_PLAMA|nr:fam-m protein [Plasmodium malariae]XP_028861417.1 fam-m protein [Plasmodium malariae]SBT85969.1 fam-m protein [Plasmodium malariae]SCN12477.1 fam-m protein [Plasmodium malariae]
MYQKNKQLPNIKFYMFILFSWIYHFWNDINSFNESLDEICKFDKKLYIGNNRLLAKYIQNKDLNISGLKENIPYNTDYEKKDIYNNERGTRGKNKQSNRNLLNKAEYYTEVVDYNSGMFDGKHFHFEKKWIKKKDYDTFLEKNRRIKNIALKKIKFRSYGFGIAIFFFFFLMGIGLPILRAYESIEGAFFTPFKTCWEFIYEGLHLETFIPKIKIQTTSQEIIPGAEYFFLGTFVVFIILLAALIIVAIPKILRNNEKYKKIKYMSE